MTLSNPIGLDLLLRPVEQLAAVLLVLDRQSMNRPCEPRDVELRLHEGGNANRLLRTLRSAYRNSLDSRRSSSLTVRRDDLLEVRICSPSLVRQARFALRLVLPVGNGVLVVHLAADREEIMERVLLVGFELGDELRAELPRDHQAVALVEVVRVGKSGQGSGLRGQQIGPLSMRPSPGFASASMIQKLSASDANQVSNRVTRVWTQGHVGRWTESRQHRR